MTPPILQLRRVRLPLASFTLEIDVEIRGRFTAIFGPSGAGKTSLLDLLAGLRRPAQAFVQLGPRILADTAARIEVPPELRRIGYVPQEGALFPHLSVRRNLQYGMRRDQGGAPANSFSWAAIVEVLEIGPLLERPGVAQLSGGERQRVALARALLSHPELLLLDEPMAGLDRELKNRVLPYLQRVRDEFQVPILLVTHAAEEVVALCDEVLILERGRLLAQGHPSQLFERRGEPAWVLKRASS